MATFSIVTTADQDRALLAKLNAANAAITAANAANPTAPQQPLWTARDYLRQMISTTLDGWVEETNQTDRQQLAAAWADPVKRAAIKVAAGIT